MESQSSNVCCPARVESARDGSQLHYRAQKPRLEQLALDTQICWVFKQGKNWLSTGCHREATSVATDVQMVNNSARRMVVATSAPAHAVRVEYSYRWRRTHVRYV